MTNENPLTHDKIMERQVKKNYLSIYSKPLQVLRKKMIKSVFLNSPEQVPRMLKIDESIFTQNYSYVQKVSELFVTSDFSYHCTSLL